MVPLQDSIKKFNFSMYMRLALQYNISVPCKINLFTKPEFLSLVKYEKINLQKPTQFLVKLTLPVKFFFYFFSTIHVGGRKEDR